MRPVVVLPPVSAFGGSFPMPSQLRDIPFNLGRTSLTTRDPAVISQAAQDYIDLRSGNASPVSDFVPAQAAFTTWKRNPYTSGATTPEYQGPAFSVAGYLTAKGMTPATAVLVATGVNGLRGFAGLGGLGGAPDTETMAEHVDRLGANRVLVKPPQDALSPVRLRPIEQRNSLPIDPMAPVHAARQGDVPSERERATAGITASLNAAVAGLLRRF